MLGVVRIGTRIRRALSSRNLFDNWLQLLFKYLVARRDVNTILNAKINDCVIPLTIKAYESLVSRYSRGLIKSIHCVNGYVYMNDVRINDINIALYDIGTWAKVLGWQYNGSYWFKNNVRFINMRDPIIEIFEENVYGFVDPRGRVVVDVGAFVGDSAIYFVLRGAEKVIAIEPHPGAYEEMLENIRLNSMEDRIIPINAGLASRMGWIKIGHVDVDSTAMTLYKFDNFGEVMTITLGEIINKYSIPNNAVLKMDCQGCEYDVILNDYEHVKLFSEVILEYHGDLMPLLNAMKRDYDCSVFDNILYCRRR